MNDIRNRFFFLLLLYLQYVLQSNNSSISVILFSLWHIVRVECQVAAMKRRIKSRIKWSEFHKLLSDKQFRRYFRMDKFCFNKLCRDIKEAVGEDDFLSERFLKYDINERKYAHLKRMNRAYEFLTGGFISGEIRLAITL